MNEPQLSWRDPSQFGKFEFVLERLMFNCRFLQILLGSGDLAGFVLNRICIKVIAKYCQAVDIKQVLDVEVYAKICVACK